MTRFVPWMLPMLMAAVAAGGYIQVAGQDIFWCGRVEAFPGTTILAVLSLAQVALYLAAMARARWERPYRLSQFAVLPFLVVAFLPVLLPHPWTLGLLSAYAAAMAWLERDDRRRNSPDGLKSRDQTNTWSRMAERTRCHPAPERDDRRRNRRRSESRDQTNTWSRMTERTRCHPAPGWQRGGVFAVATLGFLAAIGQIPLTLHGVILPDWMAWAALAAATALAAWTATRSARPANPNPAYPNIGQLIPLTLLLFPLLRARLPDIAYDSLSYKVTIPYQMAEWRTGDAAIVDGYMIGTNLQEMLNALLRILTGDWRPQLISSISYILLALIIPRAFPAGQFPPGARRAAVAFAGVAAFVLTEAGIAQGTAYQEPLLLLFMVAALIRCPLWPGFLGMAAAVKITAVFIAPLILLYHAVNYRSFWRSPRFLLLGALAGTLALGPQLSRNLTFSGRLLGMSEILAGVTDPPGPHQIMAVGIDRYDVRPRGGVINNAIQSACNVWLLDALCSVRYKGNFEAGFSVFPASRAALLAVLFGVAACLRRRRPVACLTLGGFAAGYAGLLAIVSEGRYFLPLSLGFPVMLLIDRHAGRVDGTTALGARPWLLADRCRPAARHLHQRKLDLPPRHRRRRRQPAAHGPTDAGAGLSRLVNGTIQAALRTAWPATGDPGGDRSHEQPLSRHAADLSRLHPGDDPRLHRRQSRAADQDGRRDPRRRGRASGLCRAGAGIVASGLPARASMTTGCMYSAPCGSRRTDPIARKACIDPAINRSSDRTPPPVAAPSRDTSP